MTGVVRDRAVLFVDISGSSHLYRQLGDGEAHRRVRRCLSLLHELVGTMGGRVVKNMGDGLLCDFADADTALLVAQAMQLAIEKQGDGGEQTPGIHIGCHFGPVVETDGDLFGDTVNMAARVMNLARERQIFLTLETAERLSEPLQRNVRMLQNVHVKGRRNGLTTLEYLWQQQGDLTIQTSAVRTVIFRLRLLYESREFWVDRAGLNTVNLGRSADCDITIVAPEASRVHATIEARGNKFVLVDHSSNGTYVAGKGADEICLKREEMILPARGRIALGRSTSAPRAVLVEFSHETTLSPLT